MEYTESEKLVDTLGNIIWDYIEANSGKMKVADVIYLFETIKADLMSEPEETEDENGS